MIAEAACRSREFDLSDRTLLARVGGGIRWRVTRAVLTRAIPAKTKRLIAFLTPGHEFRAGGVMAIAMMYRESLALGTIHDARVVMCTAPGDPPILRYSWFANSPYTLNLESVLKRCGPLDYLLLHIPDYQVNQVAEWLASASLNLLRNVQELHLNVMVFNIDQMEGQDVVGLTRFGKVTCTTAHEAYSTAATRESLGVPLHRLKVCTGAEFYSRSEYKDKEQLLIVSSDEHPLRETVLSKIAQELPELKIQVIQDISYEEYKRLIRRAKWSLTFGEGLDGYFAEPIFSGGISFAVFNLRFFTPAFAELETVYPSWTDLVDRITADMKRLDQPAIYQRGWQQAFDLLSDHLNTDRFRENLRAFYRGEYTFP